jgi:peptidoglycan hydrolase-like protein with peptidoglycan-binding domain
MSDANRRQIQETLHRLGYYQGPVDGIFGPLTRTSIRRFQQDIGTKQTGSLAADEANRLVTTR